MVNSVVFRAVIRYDRAIGGLSPSSFFFNEAALVMVDTGPLARSIKPLFKYIPLPWPRVIRSQVRGPWWAVVCYPGFVFGFRVSRTSAHAPKPRPDTTDDFSVSCQARLRDRGAVGTTLARTSPCARGPPSLDVAIQGRLGIGDAPCIFKARFRCFNPIFKEDQSKPSMIFL